MSAPGHDTRQQELAKAVRSVSLGTIWRMLRYPFVLLSAVIVPRLMGDRDYGKYAYFMAIYVSLDVLTDVGITQTFGRFLPEKREQDPGAIAHFLHLMLFYGVLMTLAVIVLVVLPLFLFGRIAFDPVWWLVLCLLLLLTKIEGTIFAFLYGLNQIGRYSAKELLRSAATFVVVVVMFKLAGFNGALWALVLTEVILLVCAVHWAKDSLRAPWGRLPWREFLPLFLFGLTFYVPMTIFSFIQRSGPIVIRTVSGSFEQAGYFDVANQFLQLTGTFLGLLIATLLPSASAMHSRNEHDTIDRWHRTVMTYCGVAAGLAAIVLAGCGRWVIGQFLGEEFLPVYPNALVLCLAMPSLVIAYAGTNLALLEKNPRSFIAGGVAGLALLLVGGAFLVQPLGALGVSWATVGAYAAVAAAFAVRFGLRLLRMLPGFGLSVLVGYLCAWALQEVPLGPVYGALASVALAAVYLVFLVLLDVVTLREIKTFVSTLRGKKAAVS